MPADVEVHAAPAVRGPVDDVQAADRVSTAGCRVDDLFERLHAVEQARTRVRCDGDAAGTDVAAQ